MKTVFSFFAILLLSSVPALAKEASLVCWSDPSASNHQSNQTIGVYDSVSAECTREDGSGSFLMEMTGAGIGLKHGSVTMFRVYCSEENPKDFSIFYDTGVKLNIALFGGITGAEYYAEGGKSCSVAGVGYEFGFGFVVGTLNIVGFDEGGLL